MAIFYQISIAFLVSVLELVFIFLKGYFLSIEFTLYPYLVSHNFIPYKNILDQHFPSLFFGTFSIPLLSATSPVPLLVLLLLIIILSNVLLLRFLILSSATTPVLWLTLYVVLMSYFSVNILWVESFVNLILLIILNLSLKKKVFYYYLIGFLFSQLILLRTTLLPSLFFFGLSINVINLKVVKGLILGFLASAGYLVKNNNFKEFFNLAINFNYSAYGKESAVAVGPRQGLIVFGTFLYSFYNYIKSQQLFLFLATIFSLLTIFPRFGLEHLQPFVLFVVVLASKGTSGKHIAHYLLIITFIVLILLGVYKNRYGNYFYNQEVYSFAHEIALIPGSDIYLFGASDILYPLSNKLPTGNLYIPSLPWYLNYPEFQQKLTLKLMGSSSPVIVDNLFTVDGQKLIYSASTIYDFIKMNYNLIETRGRYEIYIKKP